MSKKKLAAIIVICIVAIIIIAVTTIYPLVCPREPTSEPHLVTGSCTDHATTSLKAQGEVTDDGGAEVTRRGFYYGQNPLSGLEFDGGNYISAGSLGDYGSTHMEEGTIELWMKAQRAFGLTYRGVITTSEDDWSNLLGIWTMRPGVAPGWVPYFGIFDSDIQGLEGYADGVVIDDGEWHHIAVTWNCEIDTIEIHVDGISREVTYLRQETPSNFTNFAEDFLMGSDIWGDGGVVGVLTDVRIWTTIRTEQEINDNKGRILTGDEPRLFAYWRLDEWQGDTAYDSTANNHHGSLVDNPQWFAGGHIADETGKFGTGTYSLDIAGLQPDTWYWIRAFAENEGGSGYGNAVSCKTLAA